MPALSDVERKTLSSVVRNYLDSKRATRRKELLDAFESPGAIDSLVSTVVLEQTAKDSYLPSAIAFHYSDDPEVSASHGRNHQQVDVVPITINEYIYEKDPETLWDQFVQRNDPPPQPAPPDPVNPGPSKKQKYGGWEIIKPLGGGGQSDVFLVRTPERKRHRESYLDRLGKLSGKTYDSRGAAEVAEALWNYARPELTEELGALKQFKIPPESSMTPSSTLESEDAEAVERLKNEIAVLRKGLPGLPKILDSDEKERWIVTEYFSGRTLEYHPLKYKGNAVLALKAFRSLVQTIALLHKEGHVHRDIKPANVFVRTDVDLVPGDFGIVFSAHRPDRLTRTGERVGPRDYMAPWTNLGMRHEKVHPRDDVYMLGKLLWSMIDGHAVLPREYHKDPEYEFDLTKTFSNDVHMHMINAILDKCVVEQADRCLPGAQELLGWIDEALGVIARGGQLLRDGVPRPCRICGKGFYKPIVFPQVPNALPGLRLWLSGSETASLPVSPLACDYCGNLEFFKH